MEKGITLQTHLHVGTDQAVASNLLKRLPAAFVQANSGLQLSVKKTSQVDAKGNVTLRVYIQGEQDPAADFAALTHTALNKAIAAMNAEAKAASTGASAEAPPVHIHDIQEIEGDDEDTGVVLPPKPAPDPAPPAAQPTQAAPTSAAPPAAQPSQAVASAHAPWWAFWRRDSFH
jgi:hypothetical protein